jgi:hypothetical protein
MRYLLTGISNASCLLNRCEEHVESLDCGAFRACVVVCMVIMSIVALGDPHLRTLCCCMKSDSTSLW